LTEGSEELTAFIIGVKFSPIMDAGIMFELLNYTADLN
jgi:hypothetical protein